MTNRTSRSDLRVTAEWLRSHRFGAAFVECVLLFAGVASILGLFRWHDPIARWSFVFITWILRSSLH